MPHHDHRDTEVGGGGGVRGPWVQLVGDIKSGQTRLLVLFWQVHVVQRV